VSFDVYKGETLGIVGESGCGKSITSLSILNLVPQPKGEIHGGEIKLHRDHEVGDIAKLKRTGKKMKDIRRKDTAMIFQDPMSSLSPVYTVGSQIMEGIMLSHDVSKNDAREMAVEMLRKVGISPAEQRINDYPYQLSERNSGEIYYLTEGRDYDRYELRRFINNYKLTDRLTLKNRYDYLYNYDLDDEELDDHEEEFFSSLEYSTGKYALEAGIGQDLMAEDEDNERYLFAGHYYFDNGLNTSFRQEYNFDWKRVKERYIMSYNQHSINWNLKYIDGESYNYYPYLTLNLPPLMGVRTTLGTGRVENGGVELNKERVNLRYNFAYPLGAGLSYHLGYSYRLDHYRSSYDYNYYYTTLNTGFRYNKRLNQKVGLNSSLFFEKNYPWGKSPLPDDREDQNRLIKSALSLNIDRDLKQSSYSISVNADYDLDLEDWDEINLRLTQKEDCYNLYLNYEFIDQSISFGFEI